MRIVRASAPPRLDLLPGPGDLAFARETVAKSPLVSPVPLLRWSGVWLALECLQATGSFKIRGALAAIARRKARGVLRVVAASAGNHGAGVATVARELGVEATIVVPKTAPRKKVDVIRQSGANVIEEGDGYDAAEAFAMALANERGVPFLSPYDDVDVVAGNGGSLAIEIVEALRARGAEPGMVLAPFGGGGLASGLASGLAHALGEPCGATRRVWGVQSEASPAFALSLERGSAMTTLPFAESLADGLEGGISPDAFARAAGACAGVVVVEEEAIAAAMRFAYRELGLVVEGSAAAALVPLVARSSPSANAIAALPEDLRDELRDGTRDGRELVVVLTGRNVDRDRLARLVW